MDEIIPTFAIEHNLLEQKHFMIITWRIGSHKHGIKFDINEISHKKCMERIDKLEKELKSLRNEVRRNDMDSTFAGHEHHG